MSSRVLFQYFTRSRRVSPLTSSLALALQHPDDDTVALLACWWIAIKFEEGEYLPIKALLAEVPGVATPRTLLARGGAGARARRVRPPVPHGGAAHARVAPERVARVRRVAQPPPGVSHRAPRSPAEWARILAAAVARTSVSPVVQIMSYLVRRRTRERLCPRTPTLTLRKRARDDDVVTLQLPRPARSPPSASTTPLHEKSTIH